LIVACVVDIDDPPLAGAVQRVTCLLVVCCFQGGIDPIVSRHSDGISYPHARTQTTGRSRVNLGRAHATPSRETQGRGGGQPARQATSRDPLIAAPKIDAVDPTNGRMRSTRSRTASTDIRSGATTSPPVLPTARSPNASTPCWSGVTSLTSYRLPICREDLDGTDVPPKMPRCRSIPPTP
jgi:hypothetical protein